jgi:hypothetical protein
VLVREGLLMSPEVIKARSGSLHKESCNGKS